MHITDRSCQDWSKRSHTPYCGTRCEEKLVNMKWLVILCLVGKVSRLDNSPEGRPQFPPVHQSHKLMWKPLMVQSWCKVAQTGWRMLGAKLKKTFCTQYRASCITAWKLPPRKVLCMVRCLNQSRHEQRCSFYRVQCYISQLLSGSHLHYLSTFVLVMERYRWHERNQHHL